MLKTPRRVSPKNLVLDILRVTKPQAMSVRVLVNLGELFGFSGNAMRVAVARLVRKGTVESDERGYYQLAPSASVLTEHVESWRRGEKRVKAWKGDWLVVWLGRGAARTERRYSLRALELLGFREGLEGLWVRPNNLTVANEVVWARLDALGLESDAEHFNGSDFDEQLSKRWRTKLYETKKLTKAYKESLTSLKRSSSKIDRMPLERALVETFLLGGAAIRVLATDPLLPEEILPRTDRAALTETMIRYDVLGRRLWNRILEEQLEAAPTHVSTIALAAS